MYSVSANRPACLNGRTSAFTSHIRTPRRFGCPCAAQSRAIWELWSRSDERSEKTELIHLFGRLISPSRRPARQVPAGRRPTRRLGSPSLQLLPRGCRLRERISLSLHRLGRLGLGQQLWQAREVLA